MKLLLVEDEEDLAAIISKGLKKSGYAIDNAYDGEEAVSMYEINEYDLIILDLNLPNLDGLEVLKVIREKDIYTKVLILSARSDIEDRVIGLDMGANDYLIKPFDYKELEARIRMLLRISFTQKSAVLKCGDLKINTVSKTAYLGQSSLLLTKKEYEILEYLFLNKDMVISAEQFIEHVWDSEADLFSNSLKYHIHSIKKKMNELGCNVEYIKNIRSQGYILMEDNNEVTE
ncbi:DNA-binding response regulator [Clostridium beijerinckii]|uniref:Stage 0 sporulation protein A homolog n=2 Tax=Clostridium TaxID=1485 RepID=A0AAV3W548_9CLOT|nr:MULTISPECIES: response regulator transcription factor [Clostridium]NRZ28414.1 DNA-binding response OmpR family regulator [Clostridium beijerinckii]NYB95809.1 DNA-binding response OmpR family regulator [Clostridium beijerinckii]OOM20507.1 transcriptional regulatory protein TcrA [Clostridium beijerinckii]QES74939.1 response regulator transcription factor [Clostridium diolis]QUN34124.1 response regulator transcription factor [Clostridium beijerinckii]